VAAIPALLIALSEGLQTALWTLLLYVAVQQVESNVIQPVVQHGLVSLPLPLPCSRSSALASCSGRSASCSPPLAVGHLRRRQEAVRA
jgi:hypothetical protein